MLPLWQEELGAALAELTSGPVPISHARVGALQTVGGFTNRLIRAALRSVKARPDVMQSRCRCWQG